MSAAASDRLPFLRGASIAVARRSGRVIARATFLAEIAALAARLPDGPFIVNLCTDRVRFAAAFGAAMLRGQVTLLPSQGSGGAVADLCDRYPGLYALTDAAVPAALPCPAFAYPALASGASDAVPAFPAGQVAAILFTSGSTGQPQPSARNWGRLVAGSIAAGNALGMHQRAGVALVATVPHAHSYGLESAVMLPLQHQLLLDADRPFFPADVAAALRGPGAPGVLVTTPVHLRALVGEPQAGMRASLVLSATAPLPTDLAARAEVAFAAPVFEIYGCSEAGQVAARRTVAGDAWRCLEGFGVWRDANVSWASGPGEPDTRLADDLEMISPGEFTLRGRVAGLVNVAGKRSSLDYLTAQLLSIEGVQDAAFVMPDETTSGEVQRLAAVAVAPGHEAARLLAALRERIDPAFLPRPLRLVAALPRDALGKLPRADLLRLLEPPPATVHFACDLPVAAGHFPGNPIIPGAMLLDRVLPHLCREAGGMVESAKFHAPVRPGDSVAVTARTERGTTRFEARLEGSNQLVLSGAVRSTSPSR